MDRLGDTDYQDLLRAIASGGHYRFPDDVATRLVFVRLLVESGDIDEGLPGWKTAWQMRTTSAITTWRRKRAWAPITGSD